MENWLKYSTFSSENWRFVRKQSLEKSGPKVTKTKQQGLEINLGGCRPLPLDFLCHTMDIKIISRIPNFLTKYDVTGVTRIGKKKLNIWPSALTNCCSELIDISKESYWSPLSIECRDFEIWHNYYPILTSFSIFFFRKIRSLGQFYRW